MIQTMKRMFTMGRKKKAKAPEEVAEVQTAEVIVDTKESLMKEGYAFLKEKGDSLVFVRAGVRKIIPKP